MKKAVAIALSAAVLAPGVALAHTGADGHAHGMAAGFLHPLSGLDHILAMVLVGLLAWRIGGRATWQVPAAFVGMMIAGGVMGAAGIGLPFVETGIALSVVVLGVAVAWRVRTPAAVAIGIAGLFAVFHGHAHGTEIPEAATGLAYGAGFVLATGLLHASGLAAAYGIGQTRTRVIETAGAVASITGLVLLTGLG